MYACCVLLRMCVALRQLRDVRMYVCVAGLLLQV